MRVFEPFIVCILYLVCVLEPAVASQPNIIIILADDMGFDDVSFHGNGQIPTPNLDALASDGVLLNRHYSQPLCSPSRGSLMTGKYTVKIGLQEPNVIVPGINGSGLPLNHTLMSEYLKDLGYETHIVGKWHLGFYKEKLIPQKRGFDSHYGYYNGDEDYYFHNVPSRNLTGNDFNLNDTPDLSVKGRYSTDLYNERFQKVIKERNTSKPLFVLFAHQSVHGSPSELYQADEKWYNTTELEHIKNVNRTIFAGMMQCLDASVAAAFETLNQEGILENTIILFTSDNGGPSYLEKTFNTGASNWPLRGSKYSNLEGGVRVAGFVWSPLLQKRRYISNELYHFTDWVPTFYKLAGGDPRKLAKDIDGYDIWDSISRSSSSPRKNILIDIDTSTNHTFAGRMGDYKLVSADYDATRTDWYAAAGGGNDNQGLLQKYMMNSTVYKILEKRKDFIARESAWREDARVRCDFPSNWISPTGAGFRAAGVDYMSVKNDEAKICDFSKGPCLFNVVTDPCELYDISSSFPDKVKEIINFVDQYRAVTVESVTRYGGYNGCFFDENSDPSRNKYDAWLPWVLKCDGLLSEVC